MLGWRTLGKDSAGSQPQAVKAPTTIRPAATASASAGLRVYVVGQVKEPGVYRLPSTARVEDAVASAGGATPHADLAAINLASKLTDGQQIIVPKHGQQAAVVGGGAAAGGATAASPDAQIDLNNATTEQLDTLDGVGPATAKKILEYRAQHGPFKSVSELAQIPGIGPKKLAAMKPRLRV